jgi:hypothetical protein
LSPDAPQLNPEPPAVAVESLAELEPEPKAAPATETSLVEKGRIERVEEDTHCDGAGGSIDKTKGQNGLLKWLIFI